MGFLNPDAVYETDNGIVVKKKLLPESQRPGDKLNTPGNRPLWVTIHNTDDINEAAGTNDAEQYARATFNGNMRDVSVHFYIDETDCWQLLPLDEIGYHAADHADKNGGNWTSLAIEIIEKNGSTADDRKAEERGAKLAAWLLYSFGLGIDRLTTHRRWYSKKYCPAYILPHWEAFAVQVAGYLAELSAGAASPAVGTAAGTAKETAQPQEKLYRVQVGCYRVKENAEAMLKRLKAAGYDAILKEETAVRSVGR